MPATIVLDGGPLALDSVEAVARQPAPVALSEHAARGLRAIGAVEAAIGALA